MIKGFPKVTNTTSTPFNPSKPLRNTTNTSKPPLLPKPPGSLPIKKLSPSELQTHREKGLCYNCDDLFSNANANNLCYYSSGRKGHIFLRPSSSLKTPLLDEFYNSQQVETRISQKLIAD